MTDLKKILMKPGINGMILGGGVSLMAGETQSFVIGGRSYPVAAVGAGIGIASSFATEMVSNLILPHIPGNQKYQHLESMSLHLAGSAGATVIAGKLLNSNLNMQEAKLFGIAGMASEVLSSYIYNNFIDQALF